MPAHTEHSLGNSSTDAQPGTHQYRPTVQETTNQALENNGTSAQFGKLSEKANTPANFSTSVQSDKHLE